MSQSVDQPLQPIPEPFYRGHKILVRPLQTDDLPGLYADPAVRQAHLAYRPWQGCAPADLPQMRERLELLAQIQPALEIEALVLHQPSGTPLGLLCLSSMDALNRKAELSVAFFRAPGSRPTLEALHWVLETTLSPSSPIGLRKLVFYVQPGNTRATRLLQRLGIPLEARLLEELLPPGGQGPAIDLLRYAILQRQWQTSPARHELARLAPLRSPAAAAVSTPPD